MHAATVRSVQPRWTTEQVLALAPDPASAAAGRKLATPGSWSALGTGAGTSAVWGLCAGSGKTPYRACVDLSGPAFSCSCPSRKFPCKHALALLLLWADGTVPDATDVAPHAAAWLDGRRDRAAKAAAKKDEAAMPDPVAAARRAERRAGNVGAGVEELRTWLRDQVRTGLAGTERAGYTLVDRVAARMVDAQAPGLATAVRAVPTLAASGPDWPVRVLDHLALTHLLTTAHGRIGELPDELADVVRSRVGYPTRTEDVLATPPVRDRWDVWAMHDSVDGRLAVRRTLLRGAATGRTVALVSFAAGGQPLDVTVPPGVSIDADLHLYPGAPTRGVLGERHGEPGPPSADAGMSVHDAAAAWARALAVDPWTTQVPVVLAGVVPVPAGSSDRGWVLRDEAHALPAVASPHLWRVLAVSGGRPVSVAGEHTGDGILVCAVRGEDGLVTW